MFHPPGVTEPIPTKLLTLTSLVHPVKVLMYKELRDLRRSRPALPNACARMPPDAVLALTGRDVSEQNTINT